MCAHHRVFASKYRVGYTAIFAGVIVAAGFCRIEQHAGIASFTFNEGEYEQLLLGLLLACLFVVSFIGGTSISSQLLDKSNKIEHYHLIWVLQALLLVACGFELTSAALASLSIPLGVVTFALMLAMQKAIIAGSLADALGSNHAESVSLTSLGIELGNFISESRAGDASYNAERDKSNQAADVAAHRSALCTWFMGGSPQLSRTWIQIMSHSCCSMHCDLDPFSNL